METAASAVFESMNEVDQKTKDLLHGYLKIIHKQLPISNKFDIPALVCYIIVHYYWIDNIHEFARALWKTLHKINVVTITDNNNDPIRGFTGKELVEHTQKHVIPKLNHKNIIKDDTKNSIVKMCGNLLKHKYMRLIATSKNIIIDINDMNDKELKLIPFENSDKHLYQFENEKHRIMLCDDQPDRRAWTRGTKVQIYSSTFNGWTDGTIIEINNNDKDQLTITYGTSTQQMRKTLDRYQDDLVKSTDEFISNRKEWKKDSKIEVYSHGQYIWCSGHIEEILYAKENQPIDIFKVFYTNYNNKDFTKYADRWSPDLREIQELSPLLSEYKRGTKVRVFSNSKQEWIPGIVIDVVPIYEVVNVRYGDHEKLIPVISDDIKLINQEIDDE